MLLFRKSNSPSTFNDNVDALPWTYCQIQRSPSGPIMTSLVPSLSNCDKLISFSVCLKYQLNCRYFYFSRTEHNNEINILISHFYNDVHYVRRPSSLACWNELKRFLKLNQQHFGWEDPWQWNLDGPRWSWMVFRPWHSQFLRVFLFKLAQIW